MAAEDWPVLTIAECASSEAYSTQIGPFGEKIRAENYTPTGAPVLRGTNVNPEGRFHDDDFVFIDQKLADAEFAKFVCEADDVILCHKGTLGKIGVIPKKSRFKKYIMGNSMMKVRCDRSKLEPLYLYYWLCSRDGQDYIFSRVSQVGVPQIQRPLATLREATLPVPPVVHQRTIAAVLGSLDDKIELNRRMNATLEAMARALFQSWFVDFEPVRAKLDGRKPVGIDEATAALFPATFQDSLAGPVPKGWLSTNLGIETDLFTGFPFESARFSDASSGLRLARGDNVKEGFFHWDSKTRYWPALSPELNEYVLRTGDVLIGMDGSKVGKNWVRVRKCDLPCLLVQRVARLRPRTSVGEHFMWLLVSDPRFRFHVDAVKTGTSIPHISGGQIKAYDFIRPPIGDERIFHRFEEFVAPLGERIDANIQESRNLANLRDTLLPKLLSGEIDAMEESK